MAIVVVRTSVTDLASWEGNFPAEPIRVSEARKLAHDTFARWGMELEQVDLACLLVSEVVTNVVLHAAISPSPRNEFVAGAASALALPRAQRGRLSRQARVRTSCWTNGLICPSALVLPRLARSSRSGSGAGRPRSGSRSSMLTCGCPGSAARGERRGRRGLYLVDQLATRWGSRPTHDGKAVWFEVPLSGGAGGR
jgi:hypothetical protein